MHSVDMAKPLPFIYQADSHGDYVGLDNHVEFSCTDWSCRDLIAYASCTRNLTKSNDGHWDPLCGTSSSVIDDQQQHQKPKPQCDTNKNKGSTVSSNHSIRILHVDQPALTSTISTNHTCPIRVVRWHSNGERLLVMDESGIVSIWMMDNSVMAINKWREVLNSDAHVADGVILDAAWLGRSVKRIIGPASTQKVKSPLDYNLRYPIRKHLGPTIHVGFNGIISVESSGTAVVSIHASDDATVEKVSSSVRLGKENDRHVFDMATIGLCEDRTAVVAFVTRGAFPYLQVHRLSFTTDNLSQITIDASTPACVPLYIYPFSSLTTPNTTYKRMVGSNHRITAVALDSATGGTLFISLSVESSKGDKRITTSCVQRWENRIVTTGIPNISVVFPSTISRTGPPAKGVPPMCSWTLQAQSELLDDCIIALQISDDGLYIGASQTNGAIVVLSCENLRTLCSSSDEVVRSKVPSQLYNSDSERTLKRVRYDYDYDVEYTNGVAPKNSKSTHGKALAFSPNSCCLVGVARQGYGGVVVAPFISTLLDDSSKFTAWAARILELCIVGSIGCWDVMACLRSYSNGKLSSASAITQALEKVFALQTPFVQRRYLLNFSRTLAAAHRTFASSSPVPALISCVRLRLIAALDIFEFVGPLEYISGASSTKTSSNGSMRSFDDALEANVLLVDLLETYKPRAVLSPTLINSLQPIKQWLVHFTALVIRQAAVVSRHQAKAFGTLVAVAPADSLDLLAGALFLGNNGEGVDETLKLLRRLLVHSEILCRKDSTNNGTPATIGPSSSADGDYVRARVAEKPRAVAALFSALMAILTAVRKHGTTAKTDNFPWQIIIDASDEMALIDFVSPAFNEASLINELNIRLPNFGFACADAVQLLARTLAVPTTSTITPPPRDHISLTKLHYDDQLAVLQCCDCYAFASSTKMSGSMNWLKAWHETCLCGGSWRRVKVMKLYDNE